MARFCFSKAELTDLYVRQMKTDAEIAKMSGVTQPTVSCKRKLWGISTLDRWQRKSRRVISKRLLEDLYLHQNRTDAEIAEMFGVTKGSIGNRRKLWSIGTLRRCERHDCHPTQRQVDIIRGSLMSDAHVTHGYDHAMVQQPRKRGPNPVGHQSNLAFSHADGQLDYLYWKYDELSNLCLSSPKAVQGGKHRFRTFHHSFFTSLRREMHPIKRKVVTDDILRNLSPLSVAVWFMDDGTNLGQGSVFRFSTCCFDVPEHDLMIRFFRDRFDIRTRMAVYSGYRLLCIHKDDKGDFVDLIREHVPECMHYKIAGRYE